MMMEDNSDPLKLQDGYGLLNMSASLLFEEWDLSLTAWVHNANDETYYDLIFDVPF